MNAIDCIMFDKVGGFLKFNTGRTYDFPQEIKAYLVGEDWVGLPVVYFVDESRKMDGIVTPVNFTPNDILAAYDKGVEHPNLEVKLMIERFEAKTLILN